MWAVSQHRNVFAADATIKMARYANRIRCSRDEKPTEFIWSPRLLQFVRALWSHTTTGMAGLWFVCACITLVKNMWSRRCNTLSQRLKNNILFCEHEQYSEERKATKIRKHVVKYLLPMSGHEIFALSSAQIEWDNVTNWCPMALIGSIAGSTENGLNNSTNWGSLKEPNFKYPHWKSSLPSSNACSNNSPLRSRLRNSTGPGWWPDKGTQRYEMTASFCLLLRLTSASADTPPAPEEHGTPPVSPKKREQSKWSLICQHKTQWCYKLDGNSIGAAVETPKASFLEVERPTTNSVPELRGTPQAISWGRLAGCPEASNTKTQKSHDAIFMHRLALNTSLWKIWVATIFSL